MKRSELFTKTSKTIPADETAKNAQLLTRAGFIYKEMAGVYAYLPLGLLVIENIKKIVREEMNAIGGQEILMTSLQSQELWEKTDRWDDKQVDVWFKSKLKNGTEVGFGWSHEEQITEMMKNNISSYRDLPVKVYQFQTKLRNELRARSGLLRGREFLMKDLYSFSRSQAEHRSIYDTATETYLRIFKRLGLGGITFLTLASGGPFTKFSHEFQTTIDSGEDTIYLDNDRKIAINQEVYNDDVITEQKLDKSKLKKLKATEVGNIFSFGDIKSRQLGLYFADQDGNQKPVILGSYGIGVSRLVGVIAEHFADAKGLVWPEDVAPAKIYLASLGDSEAVIKQADSMYSLLTGASISVLYDNRNVRPGEKFADADLMGIPYRVVVSDNTVISGTYEWKARTSDVTKQLNQTELMKLLGA
ncbi:MAG: proline--tRNA ligase [Candidatus Saccharimonadales bacterium]